MSENLLCTSFETSFIFIGVFGPDESSMDNPRFSEDGDFRAQDFPFVFSGVFSNWFLKC